MVCVQKVEIILTTFFRIGRQWKLVTNIRKQKLFHVEMEMPSPKMLNHCAKKKTEMEKF